MADTKIDWATKSWNVTTGCTKISAGCKYCYAERMSKRLAGRCGYPADDPFRVTLHPDRLDEPLSWRKPQRVFVCSMGDLFHKDVPDDFIDDVFAMMALSPQHTFIILTKRPGRMCDYINRLVDDDYHVLSLMALTECAPWYRLQNRTIDCTTDENGHMDDIHLSLPLLNVWLGVSVEDQKTADERIPLLLQTPAAVRLVSVEPILEYIDLDDYLDHPIVGWQSESDPYDSPIYQLDAPRLDWVICGSESGHNARPFDIDWARSLKDQCENFEIPFFLKQMQVNGKLVKMPYLDRQVWGQYPEVV